MSIMPAVNPSFSAALYPKTDLQDYSHRRPRQRGTDLVEVHRLK
jgi:hypothetical protein